MTTTATNSDATTRAAQLLDDATIDHYHTHGFTAVRGVFSPEQCERFRSRALELREEWTARDDNRAKSNVFAQLVNVWREDPVIRELTLDPVLGALATQVAGVPLRLWHDQLLIKEGGKSVATEFHQDQPYWPHAESEHPISAWIALQDTPPERGCMTFLPGSHQRTDLTAQNLRDARSLFALCPDLEWGPRITMPLRAGDLTFHHGRCAHMATPNTTDDFRVAHVVIFMDRGTRFSGKGHVVTKPLELQEGDPLEGELFPVTG